MNTKARDLMIKLAQPVRPAVGMKKEAGPFLDGVKGFGQGLWDGIKNPVRTLGNAWDVGRGALQMGVGAAGTAAGRVGQLGGKALDATGLTQNAGAAMKGFADTMQGAAAAGARDIAKPWTDPGRATSHVNDWTQQQDHLMRQQGAHRLADAMNFARSIEQDSLAGAAMGGAAGGVGRGMQLAGRVPGLRSLSRVGTKMTQFGNSPASSLPGAVVAEEVGQQAADLAYGTDPHGRPNVPISPAGRYRENISGPRREREFNTHMDQAVASGQQQVDDHYSQQRAQFDEHVQQFVSQNPELAQQYGEQAAGAMQQSLQSEAGQAELGSLNETGQLSPAGQNQAVDTLQNQDQLDPESAWGIFDKMSGWEHLALWSGLGLSAIGLLNMLGGEGGLGSIVMALLGGGAALGGAASAGILGEGAQGMAQGAMQQASDFIGGFNQPADSGPGAAGSQPGSPQPDSPQLAGAPEGAGAMVKEVLQLPPAAQAPVFRMMASMYPEQAAKMDQAAEAYLNAPAWQFGLGKRYVTNQLQQQLGLSPEQAEPFLQAWQAARQSGQVASVPQQSQPLADMWSGATGGSY